MNKNQSTPTFIRELGMIEKWKREKLKGIIQLILSINKTIEQTAPTKPKNKNAIINTVTNE